ncbi:MAG: hypothetical protein ACE5FU_12055, partial [Nitrospinota bacterium]
MFSTDKTLKKNLVVKKFSLLVLLSSLLCSCSKKEAENPGQSDAPKKSAASKPATKTELTSRTIEKLITIQNKINAFKRKHGSLPEMDAFGTSYDMWKGRIEFTLMKGNPDYDYMLQS